MQVAPTTVGESATIWTVTGARRDIPRGRKGVQGADAPDHCPRLCLVTGTSGLLVFSTLIISSESIWTEGFSFPPDCRDYCTRETFSILGVQQVRGMNKTNEKKRGFKK